MPKRKKGTVVVESVDGWLRLRWRYNTRRHAMRLGYPDTPTNRSIAQLTANQIEHDMIFRCFDPTLEKYKGVPQEEKQERAETASLSDLWRRYREYKRPQSKPSTQGTTYRQVARDIEKLPTQDPIEGAIEIRNWALESKTTDAAKRFLTQLNACCEWAVESGLLPENRFNGMAAKIKISRSQRRRHYGSDDEWDINPFSVEERDRIVQGFEANQYFKFYAPFVQFLFATGCRPSEALGLQWQHIAKGGAAIRFEQTLTGGEDGRLLIVEGLKTQERRTFDCNERLREVLRQHRERAIAQAARKGRAEDIKSALVFPGPRGGYLHWHNFGQRGWATVLRECAIEYRKPYQCRHTFITLALRHGLSPEEVAKLVGTSPKVIYEHYVGVSKKIKVPEF